MFGSLLWSYFRDTVCKCDLALIWLSWNISIQQPSWWVFIAAGFKGLPSNETPRMQAVLEMFFLLARLISLWLIDGLGPGGLDSWDPNHQPQTTIDHIISWQLKKENQMRQLFCLDTCQTDESGRSYFADLWWLRDCFNFAMDIQRQSGETSGETAVKTTKLHFEEDDYCPVCRWLHL